MDTGNGKTNGKGRRTIADLSPDAIALRKRLETLNPGDTVSYADLTALIGADVQTSRHGALYRARAILLREKSMVFAPIKGEGLKRLGDEDISRLGYAIIRRVRKAAARGMKTLACVANFDKLSTDGQVAHNATMTMMSAFHQFSAPTRMAKIETAVRESRAAIPSGRVLEMFK